MFVKKYAISQLQKRESIPICFCVANKRMSKWKYTVYFTMCKNPVAVWHFIDYFSYKERTKQEYDFLIADYCKIYKVDFFVFLTIWLDYVDRNGFYIVKNR